MRAKATRGAALWLGLALFTSLHEPTPAPPSSSLLSGQVVPLADVLKSRKIAHDPEPIARQVVVQSDDGTLTPLLSDEVSRAFFVDARLRGRKTELKIRRFPGLPYVQALSVRVEDGGRMRVPEYFCDICTIAAPSPQVCPCCQGEMVLRMRPEPGE